jgi:hypothetical protein
LAKKRDGRRKDVPKVTSPAPTPQTTSPKRTDTFSKLGLLVVGAALSVLGGFGLHVWWEWYNRPILQIWYSASGIVWYGEVDGRLRRDGVVVYDFNNKCLVGALDTTGPATDLQLTQAKGDVVAMLYLYNRGRAPVTDVRLGVHFDGLAALRTETSPNLSVIALAPGKYTDDPETITVAAVPPHSGGLVTATAGLPSSEFSVRQDPDPSKTSVQFIRSRELHVLYLGSKELINSPDFFPMSTESALLHEAELTGRTTVRLPSGVSVMHKTAKFIEHQATCPQEGPREWWVDIASAPLSGTNP